jgi:hypothetical protein
MKASLTRPDQSLWQSPIRVGQAEAWAKEAAQREEPPRRVIRLFNKMSNYAGDELESRSEDSLPVNSELVPVPSMVGEGYLLNFFSLIISKSS